ncbi:MAG: hypothetical protein IPH88_07715 [Bacteroidales bacterium]|nr:hypothetical protein [Bacteroidales bacterium]
MRKSMTLFLKALPLLLVLLAFTGLRAQENANSSTRLRRHRYRLRSLEFDLTFLTSDATQNFKLPQFRPVFLLIRLFMLAEL